MARTSQLQQIGHPCRTKLESDHLQADEDHFAVLSPTSLDGQISEMSSATDQLRDSFVENSTMFPPSTVAWPSYPYGHESLPAAPVFTEHRSNAYSAHDAPPNNSPFASQAIWPSSGPSGSCTPTLGYEGFVASYETGRAVPYGSADTHTVDPTITFDHRPVHSAPAFPPAGPCSTSPPSIKDWMSPASSDQHAEFSCIAAQLHSRSPSFLGATQLLRRDGIRKKNARFEIPAERNLRTIDHMINQTNDEHEIKELKQQKRLLRNRQAALDSRQRKKQHTERLEEEKKEYTNMINDLEEALSEIKLQEAEWIREKESWVTTQQRYKQYIDTIVMEKEELVRHHTIESGELRKKNSLLTEQIQRMESTAMSTAPSSTGFSADFSDFDQLTMNSSPWDNFSIANEFSIEDEPVVETSMLAAASTSSAYSKPEDLIVKDDEKTAASGFLLMLLLCGAWIASRGSSSASTNNGLPMMSDDMRAASATVLDHIYQDAGINPPRRSLPSLHSVPLSRSSPRFNDPYKGHTTHGAYGGVDVPVTPLERLHERLTKPNEFQLRQQAFSLTPAQYNDLSTDGALLSHQNPNSNTGRSLGEALTRIRSASRGPAAEVYTRSLLMERIPSEIVKDFARMVGESAAGPQVPLKPEPPA